jgi:3-oxoacyl-[acyl-carrier-protein] synthase-3
MDNFSLPQHWGLCQAPIDGTFTSRSRELFALNVHVPPNLRRVIEGQGWTPDEVDHYVFHQPSEHMVVKVLNGLGVDPAKGILTHHLFGNTSSTTVALTMHQLLAEGRVRRGDKLCFASAAAGFSLVSALGEWRT